MNLNEMVHKNKILNDVEVAKMLRLNPQTLRVRRMKKQPPRFLRIGGKIFYKEEDVINFMDSCYEEPLEAVSNDKAEG